MAGLKIGLSAEHHVFFLRNQFQLVGIGFAEAANHPSCAFAHARFLGIRQRANDGRRNFAGRDHFALDRVQESVPPGGARNESFGGGAAHNRRKAVPARDQSLRHVVATNFA